MKIEEFISEKEYESFKNIGNVNLWYEEVRECYIKIKEKIEKPDLYGKTLLVNEKQLPEIHILVKEIASILEMELPAVYVYEDFYYGVESKGIEKPWIEISSKTIMDLKREEIKFLLARAMCEIKLKHTEKKMVFNEYLNLLDSVPTLNVGDILENISKVKLYKWARISNYTEDNFGYLIVKDIDICISAILKTILNSCFLSENINIAEYIKQAEKINSLDDNIHNYTKLDEKVPYGPFRIKNLISFASSRRGMNIY